MTPYFLISWAFLLLVMAGGCKDDETGEDLLLTHLTQSPWTFDEVISSTLPEEQQADINANLAGNAIHFKADGTYETWMDGDSGDSGVWELGSNRNTIVMDKGTTGELIVGLKSVDASSLHIITTAYDLNSNAFPNTEMRWIR
jgi:hypothetical protein